MKPEDFPDPGYYDVSAVCFGLEDESDHWSSAEAAVDWAVDKINNYKVPKTEILS